MDGKTIVILGGGTGGLMAANALQRRLPSKHRIILIEKEAFHAFAPSFLWIMVGQRQPEKIRTPIRMLVHPRVQCIIDIVTQIDVENQKIRTSNATWDYDYLIVALGAELAPEKMPGLESNAHTFYTYDGSIKLYHALKNFSAGKIAIVVASLPYKCPGAPYEGAMLIADFFHRQGRDAQVSVHLFTPEPQPLPVAGPALGQQVEAMLARKGVSYYPLHSLEKVDAQKHQLHFTNGQLFHYDLLVIIPPHRCPEVVARSPLANAAGWIPVDPATLTTSYPHVFAIGDVTAIPLPGRWKPDVPLSLPKAGVFAHGQALTVAHHIANEILGKKSNMQFCGDGFCMLEAGEDMAGFAYGNFFAQPAPQVQFYKLGKIWHVGKILFEKWWLAPQGPYREMLRLALTAGARLSRVPVTF